MKHSPGQPVEFNAATQNKVEELANSATIGALLNSQFSRSPLAIRMRAKNTSGTLMPVHSLCQISDTLSDADKHQGKKDPTLEVETPVWPNVFGSFGITLMPIPSGRFGDIALSGVCVARGTFNSGDQYAAPDPADPSKLKSANTGEVRVLGFNSNLALVAVGLNPIVLWNYERTADHPTQSVKLLELDDVNFSGTSTVDLVDPRNYMDHQVTGDKGTCIQAGNIFFPMQANC